MGEYYDNFLFWLQTKGCPNMVLNLLSPGYYVYLFSDLKWANDGRFHKLQVIWCRLRGHPAGPVWYNSGFEPDMSCKNCGDHI